MESRELDAEVVNAKRVSVKSTQRAARITGISSAQPRARKNAEWIVNSVQPSRTAQTRASNAVSFAAQIAAAAGPMRCATSSSAASLHAMERPAATTVAEEAAAVALDLMNASTVIAWHVSPNATERIAVRTDAEAFAVAAKTAKFATKGYAPSESVLTSVEVATLCS